MKKLEKKRKIMSQMPLSAAILARRRRPVASLIALDPLRRSMRLVTYRRIDRASETADKYGTFLLGIRPRRLTGAIRPEYSPNGGWRRLVALREALIPLYRAISAVTCRRISSSVETGRIGVHLFVVDDRAINLTLSN
jgi:hypothetical protein